jgi:hypothetical protein
LGINIHSGNYAKTGTFLKKLLFLNYVLHMNATATTIASLEGHDTIMGKGVTKFSLALTALLGVVGGRTRPSA